MPSSPVEPADLLDLKLMPAWVKEPVDTGNYADHPGEQMFDRPQSRDRQGAGRDRRPKRSAARPSFGKTDRRQRPERGPGARPQREERSPERPPAPQAPVEINVRFLPRSGPLENVVAQIQSDALAYSLFFLSRLFLEKPQRYEVQLKAKAESPMFRLGDDGAPSLDSSFLETNAFRFARENFYGVEVTQSEPVKGNFASVARCRLSGTVLGPTNHHAYQPRLRALYEQRFSRRMTFSDYQRQIEIVSDPAVVEHWKEEARNITSFTTLREETPATFSSAADAERHFRQNYLPGLVSAAEELTVDGLMSRQLPDRRLNRHVEEAWAAENRSPSNMMQELAKKFREAGLYIFRHRRGMLFVSSIRVRPFVYDETNVSPHVNAILETVSATPRIHRKELAEKLLTGPDAEDAEARKLALASDLRWLISEGYVIEFNDGSLDLPRAKTKEPGEKTAVDAVAAVVSIAEPMEGGAPATPEPVAAIAPNRQEDAAAPADKAHEPIA